VLKQADKQESTSTATWRLFQSTPAFSVAMFTSSVVVAPSARAEEKDALA
jgi:hypothetical protein